MNLFTLISKHETNCRKVAAWLSRDNLVSVRAPACSRLLSTKSKGKTCFLYYLLFLLLSSKKTVAFHVNEQFILLFQDTGVHLHNTSFGSLPKGKWALTGSRLELCDTFLCGLYSGTAWIVQTTSPPEAKWRRWQKVHTSPVYYMDVCSLGELLALG